MRRCRATRRYKQKGGRCGGGQAKRGRETKGSTIDPPPPLFTRHPSPPPPQIPIVGWSAAAVSALFIVEKIVHTVGLDVLLGFPIQLVGILALPGLVARYVLDGKDALEDAGAYVNDIAKRLPGLK